MWYTWDAPRYRISPPFPVPPVCPAASSVVVLRSMMYTSFMPLHERAIWSRALANQSVSSASSQHDRLIPRGTDIIDVEQLRWPRPRHSCLWFRHNLGLSGPMRTNARRSQHRPNQRLDLNDVRSGQTLFSPPGESLAIAGFRPAWRASSSVRSSMHHEKVAVGHGLDIVM